MMDSCLFTVSSFFDGHVLRNEGPYTLVVENARIIDIVPGPLAAGRSSLPERFCVSEVPIVHAEFLMPGLVEAHCHLFLDGGELDFRARKDYFSAHEDVMMQTARQHVRDCLANGVTLIRDAGDRYGINHKIRDEFAGSYVKIRSPGLALRRPKKYGAFMAQEVESLQEMRDAVAEISADADDLKIILTGIIDFEAGTVTKPVQFDRESLRVLIDLAREHQLPTFAHCSGIEGLEIASDMGVDSIEHGFFMSCEVLKAMAEKSIAWVPTFSPVHFQWHQPEIVGWNQSTVKNLRSILDSHRKHVAMAHELGVALVAGSDAGSHGVRHGYALIEELFFMLDAGLPMASVLASATSVPRKRWSERSANIQVGNDANFVALQASPFEQAESLRHVEFVFNAGTMLKEGQVVALVPGVRRMSGG